MVVEAIKESEDLLLDYARAMRQMGFSEDEIKAILTVDTDTTEIKNK